MTDAHGEPMLGTTGGGPGAPPPGGRPPRDTDPEAAAPQAGATETDAPDAAASETGAREMGVPEAAAEIEFIAAERVIFFSDAVVAIAITLLALGLPLPHGSTLSSNRSVLRSMLQDGNAYLTFLISFAVIGTQWRVHHRLFMYVARLDRRLITVNMVWLLMIVLMPFATRVLSGNGGFGIRFSLYALIQALTALCFLQMMRMLHDHALQRPDAPAPEDGGHLLLLTVAAMFLISIPIAFVTQWAYVCWIAIPVVARVMRRLHPANGATETPADTGWARLIRPARRPAPDRARPPARQ
jgi:uncharacterized membrane protein